MTNNNTHTADANTITEIVLILDRSGSMAGLEDDTVGGFNAMIETQKKTAGAVYVSTVLFDHESEVLHDRVPLAEVQPLTRDTYTPRGSTALYDAVGGAIHHIGNIHKYARREDVPHKTLFVITTDGMENASRRYSREQVKAMIARQQEKYGWEFLFLGANMDAAETAETIGIHKQNAVDYHADTCGTRKNYAAVSEAVTQIRAAQPLDGTWRRELDRDYKARKKGLFRK